MNRLENIFLSFVSVLGFTLLKYAAVVNALLIG